jgi:hypothetical protein
MSQVNALVIIVLVDRSEWYGLRFNVHPSLSGMALQCMGSKP